MRRITTVQSSSSLITRPLEKYEGYALTIATSLGDDDFLKEACQTIIRKLDQYNLEITGPLTKRRIFYTEPQHLSMVIGEICQHSVNIDNRIHPETLERILLSHPEFLTVFQAKAYEWGARRCFTWCYQGSILAEIFINDGFHLCGQFPDLHECQVVLRLYKDIENVPSSSESSLNITISQDAYYESYEELNPYGSEQVNNSFGVFIHNEEKILKAGLFGTIYIDNNKGIPHGEIQCLWVDDALRNKGLATLLMKETEYLLRQQGTQYIQLATNGFQAPEFYQKMGYDISESCPNYYNLAKGCYSIFDFTKKL